MNEKAQLIAGALILALMLVVALSPATVYAPTPRVILFLLGGTLPAILFGAKAA